ncbi:MAG: DNA polymerase III subunit gamma/tau [Candidatus Nomurabacteria bacterium]|nr:MAG: DNA polymerase III subunit gamma/tau [Candidatus Nomurabacteria bacterium]
MAGTTSLSRTYRPQTFADLVNQKHIRLPLEREIISDRIGHAYMFTGPRGVGKTTTARIFAKAINCAQRQGAEPCTKCANCQAFRENRAMDVIEMDAASHTQVDNVRENIIPNARTRPSVFPYKVFIIDEVHMLSTSAFNALLKIIEEPPEFVVFIFATTDIERVPETIISRCQRFDFRRLEAEDLLDRLQDLCKKEKVKVVDSVLEQVAHLADGSIRDAESLLSQLLSLEEKEITEEVAAMVLPRRDRERAIKVFTAITEADPLQARNELREALAAGSRVEQFYLDMLGVVQDLIQTAAEKQAKKGDIAELSTKLRPGMLSSWLRGLLELEGMLRDVQVPELPIELFILEQSQGGETISRPPEDPPSPPEPPSTPSAPTEEIPQVEEKTEAPAPKAKKEKPVKASLPADVGVQKLWESLVLKVSESSHSLAVVLKVCRPKAKEEGVFTISAAYPFHRDQLLEHKNRAVLLEALRELTGEDLKIEGVVERVEYTRADDIPQRLDDVSLDTSDRVAPAKAAPSRSEVSTGDSTWDKVLQAFSA